MSDSAKFAIVIVIAIALFNPQCQCVKHIGRFLNQNTSDVSVGR